MLQRVIATVRATDADSGLNGAVRYGLLDPNVPFSLDNTTGVLRLASPLDFELVRRSEEHTSELQSQFRISYAVFCLKKKTKKKNTKQKQKTKTKTNNNNNKRQMSIHTTNRSSKVLTQRRRQHTKVGQGQKLANTDKTSTTL